MEKRLKLRLLVLVTLLLCVAFTLYFVFRFSRAGLLTVAFLDIGQGDSIFIESPTGNQMLIDGGPGRGVLRELSKVMPFYDRSINVVLATHPDADHIGGLNDVMDRFKTEIFLEPGVEGDTAMYKNLENKVADKERKGETKKIVARRGMNIDLGGGAILEILFPDKDVTNWETNDASIVARLVYGENEFLLTGDSPISTERYILSLDGAHGGDLQSDVLKVGHHGSRTSTAPEYVQVVAPEYAVISVGADNRYGHPTQETLDTLTKAGIKILRTDIDGRIIFKSDGVNLEVK